MGDNSRIATDFSDMSLENIKEPTIFTRGKKMTDKIEESSDRGMPKIQEGIHKVIFQLLDGDTKVTKTISGCTITGYWVGNIIRIDLKNLVSSN